MSAQNTASIQTLLEAEKDAQQIVEKARQYRTQRLKDARSEAQKEIEKYKSKKDAEFKDYESKVSCYERCVSSIPYLCIEFRQQRRGRKGGPEINRITDGRNQEHAEGRQESYSG